MKFLNAMKKASATTPDCGAAPVILDVRSPAEYARGHIPGAVSFPLFSDGERAAVGKLYLQRGQQEAMMKGLEIVGPKMKDFAERAVNLASGRDVLLYCWRGGMRSDSMAWLMNRVGIRASVMPGGYKAWRRSAHEFFGRPFRLAVVGGLTGTGKSEVLEALERKGMQVLHLEKLASHRGSVFGTIGMPPQPTNEQFENDLYDALKAMDPEQPIAVEDESLAIGRLFIPRPFFERMKASPLIRLTAARQERIERLVNIYVPDRQNGCTGDITTTAPPAQQLITAIRSLEKRLGGKNTTLAIRAVEEGNLPLAVSLVLDYYDKLYERGISMRPFPPVAEIQVHSGDMDDAAARITDICHSIPFP